MQVQARQGERWDTICYRIYKRATIDDVMTLRKANRDTVKAGATFEFAGGELLTVPMINIVQTSTDAGVAPWQR